MIEASHSGKRLFSMLDRRIRLLAKHVGRDFSLQEHEDKKTAARKLRYATLLKEQHGLDAAGAAKLLGRAMQQHQETNGSSARQRWVKVGG